MNAADARASWETWWSLFVREDPDASAGFGEPTDVEITTSSETLAFAAVTFERSTFESGAKGLTEVLFEWEPGKGWRLVF